MSTKRPKALFYLVVKQVSTRPHYKTKMLTVYANGVPKTLAGFTKWLSERIEKGTEGER